MCASTVGGGGKGGGELQLVPEVTTECVRDILRKKQAFALSLDSFKVK